MLRKRVVEQGTTYRANPADAVQDAWSLPHVALGVGLAAGGLAVSVALQGVASMTVAVLAVASGCLAGWCFRSARVRPVTPRALPEVSPDPPGTWTVDFRLGHATYDDACASMLGYEPGEIESTMASWGALVHPDDLTSARQLLDAHTQGGSEHYRAVVRMRHRDGHWVWIEDEGRVIERGPRGKAWRARGRHRLLVPHAEGSPHVFAAELAAELRGVLAAVEGNLELQSWEGSSGASVDDAPLRRSLARGRHKLHQLAVYGHSAASGGSGEPIEAQRALHSAADALSAWSDRPIQIADSESVHVGGASVWLSTAAVALLDMLDQHCPGGVPIVIDVRREDGELVLEFEADAPSQGELPAVPLMIARTLVENAGATLRRVAEQRLRLELPASMLKSLV